MITHWILVPAKYLYDFLSLHIKNKKQIKEISVLFYDANGVLHTKNETLSCTHKLRNVISSVPKLMFVSSSNWREMIDKEYYASTSHKLLLQAR